MRKLILSAVATAMLTVTGASANSCDKEAVVKSFENNTKNLTKFLNNKKDKNYDAFIMGSMTGVGEVYNTQIGTLQSNVTNLQLPTSTLTINNNWAAILYKINSYFGGSKDEKELYYRLSQYNYYILKNVVSKAPEIYNDITLQKGMTKDHAWTVLDVALSNRNTKDERQNALRSFIIFSLIADPTADDSFAKKYFSKHDEVLNCVKQAIGL